jgi:hypothetical protein
MPSLPHELEHELFVFAGKRRVHYFQRPRGDASAESICVRDSATSRALFDQAETEHISDRAQRRVHGEHPCARGS